MSGWFWLPPTSLCRHICQKQFYTFGGAMVLTALVIQQASSTLTDFESTGTLSQPSSSVGLASDSIAAVEFMKHWVTAFSWSHFSWRSMV